MRPTAPMPAARAQVAPLSALTQTWPAEALVLAGSASRVAT
jgi:hypothetical protein